MSILDKAHKEGLVVGLKEVAGVAPRIDIDLLLLNHPDIFNLLLIALKELKGEDVPWPIDKDFEVKKDDKMSFYQIAGIHGLPRTPWDDESAPGKTPHAGEKGFAAAGYCAHATPTFGTWHRPYLAMLEQALFRQIANVADRFSRSAKLTANEKKVYTDGAKQFRLPYWDYYRPRGYRITIPGVIDNGKTTTPPYDYHMPHIFTLPQVMVKTLPDNELKLMDNPFFQYKFASTDIKPEEWDVAGINTSIPEVKAHTLRYGNEGDRWAEAMNEALNKIREDQMRTSLCMIERGEYGNFKYFSTAGVTMKGSDPDDPSKILKKPTGSIENLHNQYHIYCGGFADKGQYQGKTGHMICVPVAAFDPVFWTHHCQIDRLFAIWQAVNAGHWFDELDTPELRELATAGLLPFRKSPLDTDKKKRFWNSDIAKEIDVLGYTYPDVSSKSVDQIRDKFAGNYGWSRRLTPFQHFGKPPTDMEPLDLSGAQVYQYSSGAPSAKLFKHLTPSTEFAQAHLVKSSTSVEANVSHEWYIDDVVERMAMNGAFTIFYIIGNVTGDSGQDWSKLPGFVGVNHVFAAPREACDNCGNQEEQAHLVTGTTPMTSLLLDYVINGSLNSMEVEDVKPFLVKNLKWRAQTASGDVIDPRQLKNHHSLNLSISTKTTPLPGQPGEPTYSFHPDVIEQIIANAS